MLSVRLRFITLLALVALLCGGCGGNGNAVAGDETNDPVYQQAQDLKKQGRYNEALNAFLKEIDHRGETGAPESHLEAGALYLNWSHNPIEAYHHFSKYLELEPTGPRASIVRGQRDAAAREILKYLRTPIDGQAAEADQSAEVARLQREVAELRAENQTLRGASSVPAVRSAPVIDLSAVTGNRPSVGDDTPVTPVQIPPPESPFARSSASRESTSDSAGSRRGAVARQANPVAAQPRATVPQRPATSSAGRRTHTVVPGEKSLWGIARTYYGSVNQARINALFEANRDVMRDPNDLRVGMVLRIP